MSYDLHGVWDAASKFIGPYVATHTNITEIDQGMELLWRAGVEPENVVLGQGCKLVNPVSSVSIYRHFSLRSFFQALGSNV